LGAYVADTRWGRFKTVGVAVAIALVGHIILIVSAVPGVIEKESAVGAFIVAMIVTGFGTLCLLYARLALQTEALYRDRFIQGQYFPFDC
jgi:dipeptide/tripeptide permease